MANVIDLLLQADIKQLQQKNTTKYKVKSLSDKLKTDFVLTLQSIGGREYTEIQKRAISFNKKGISDADLYKMQAFTILAGVKEPDLHNSQLCKKFGVATPAELIDKLFTPAEISEITAEINKLCGFEDPASTAEEIKNS